MSEYILELNNIDKAFPGVQALDNVTLRVKRGEVHACVGENGAGKSTLMKCLFGLYKKDGGEILYEGRSVSYASPKAALENGISMVHQELDQVPQQSVMENIWMGRYLKRNKLIIDTKRMHSEARKFLEFLGVNIDTRTKIANISVSVRQLIEISKALSYDAKVIVLDEPTSSLTENEAEILFSAIRKLTEGGCSVIYISHKLNEIFKICDTITILRDGKSIITTPVSEITNDEIIRHMVNRELTDRFPPKDNVVGEKVALEVRNLSSFYPPRFEDVSFQLHEGEILGISGLIGSRRTELVETIYGYRKRDSGKVFQNGKEINVNRTDQAIRKGLSLVTEERRTTGIFPLANIIDNTVIASIKSYRNKFRLLSGKKLMAITRRSIDTMRIKTPGPKTKIRDLSGGNQQKVILGRWLLTNTEILLLDEPTRGIDVGAKYEIYQLMINMAKAGKAIVFVSSEMPELLGVADRILVMSNGRMSGIVDAKTTDQEELMTLAAKHF